MATIMRYFLLQILLFKFWISKNKNIRNTFAYLSAENQKNDGHGQLYQHQDEQQGAKLQVIEKKKKY